MFDQRLLQTLLGPLAQGPQQQAAQPNQQPDRRSELLRGAGFAEQMRLLSPRQQTDTPWSPAPSGTTNDPAQMAKAGALLMVMLTAAKSNSAASAPKDGASWVARAKANEHKLPDKPRQQTNNLANNLPQNTLSQNNAAVNPQFVNNAAVDPNFVHNAKATLPGNMAADVGKYEQQLLPVYKGYLKVDQEKGQVTTPGGYKIIIKDGVVRIEISKGKFTSMKAEPPGKTLTSKSSKSETRRNEVVERQLARDPAVRESDGDVWRYAGTGSFILPDGTKVTVQETGATHDLHINQVDIYNGDKHVAVKSQLVKSAYKTVRTETKTENGAWQTTRSRREDRWSGRRGQRVRIDDQKREVTTTRIEYQEAVQEFKTTFSGVSNDAKAHDEELDDGFQFKLAGHGEAWAVGNREVLSGAGKGKDDKTKAFQLGGEIERV